MRLLATIGLALLLCPQPRPTETWPEAKRAWESGLAVRYAKGTMERVAAIRGIPSQPCMVAWTYADDADVGERWIVVEGARTGVQRKCLTVDLPQPRDRANLIRRGIAVELDYRSAAAVCGASWEGAARECPIRWRVLP